MSAVHVIFSFFWMDNDPARPPGPPHVKILISIVKKKVNENYVEFYFRMGTVLVIFSIFWMDNDLVNAPPPPEW